jgi:hypothetical protein
MAKAVNNGEQILIRTVTVGIRKKKLLVRTVTVRIIEK